MSFTGRWIGEGFYCICEGRGNLTTVEAAMRAFMDDRRSETATWHLVDISGVTEFAMSELDIKRISAYDIGYDKNRFRTLHFAFVAPHPTGASNCQIYKSVMQKHSSNRIVEIFPTLEEACLWLSKKVEGFSLETCTI